MNKKYWYLFQALLGLALLASLGGAIYYLIAVNPLSGVIGSVFVGFLILWFLYVLLSVPGELKGLAMVLRADEPEKMIAELSERRRRKRL